MNGIRVDSADNLPPGVKAISQELDETESRLQGRAATPADLQEILEKLEKLRKAMVQQIRPDVFTSEPYRKYLEENHRDSQVSGSSSPGEETVYEVWREGLGFTMVERAGAMKILWVHQAWMESRIEPQPEVGPSYETAKWTSDWRCSSDLATRRKEIRDRATRALRGQRVAAPGEWVL